MKYNIYARYQYHPNRHIENFEPVVWCRWFSMDVEPSENLTSLKDRLKEMKAFSKKIDRATKLRHEYEIREVEE